MNPRCRIVSLALRLRRPFVASGWTLKHRDILLLEIHDPGSGHSGWGEAAPLHAFGTESLAEAQDALERAVAVLSDTDTDILCDGSAGQISNGIDERFPWLRAARTARYAVECALLDLAARRRGLPLRLLLAEEDHGGEDAAAFEGPATGSARVAVNGVIGMGSPEESAGAAVRLVAEGYGCVKMKVGGASLEEDIHRVRAVRMAVPEEVLLRLDANGAWDFAAAEEALREFALYDVEYVEQPVAAEFTDELAALTALEIMPVAADESAQDIDEARVLLARGGADVFVIKPMAAGGLVDARRFAREAAAAGRDVVFTSLVDSAVGRSAVAQLCASLPSLRRHHGLATGDFFLDDTAVDTIEGGRLILPDEPGIGVTPTRSSLRATHSLLSANALRWPGRRALIDGERSWTWAELHAEARAVAGRLSVEHGVRPGDIVATLLGNTGGHIILLHAIWLCGAAAAPLNTRLTQTERRRQLALLTPALMVVGADADGESVGTGTTTVTVDELLMVVNEEAVSTSVAQPTGGTPEAPPDGMNDGALCSVLFTSGSSGTLKAVPHRWGNHRASAMGSAANLGVRDDDNWLCLIPLFHIGGLAIVTRCLLYGTAMTVRQGFDAAAVTRELRERRVTLLSVVPTMLSRLLEADATLAAATLPALRAILLGGAAASPALWEEAMRRGLPVLGTYGLTESCSQVVTASPAEAEAMAGTAGRPIGGAELRIVCGDGKDCPEGTEGEIHLRGPMLTDGYLGVEGQEDFADGWFRTRDVGFIDARGCLHVCGRADDMILTGGENVFPTEIEDVLLRYPGVSDAAVAGIPDEEWGARLGALLALDGEEDLASLERWCRQQLAGYKIPRLWRRVREIPRTASGKIIRAEVRRLLRVEDPTTRLTDNNR